MHFYNINTKVMSNANIYINLVEVIFADKSWLQAGIRSTKTMLS